jgi:hypothetical protein
MVVDLDIFNAEEDGEVKVDHCKFQGDFYIATGPACAGVEIYFGDHPIMAPFQDLDVNSAIMSMVQSPLQYWLDTPREIIG